jgi:membrane associated rhomboid family serine protease
VIPLRDVIPSRTTPVVTIALIVLNVVVFIHELLLSPAALRHFYFTAGLVPASFSWLALVTSMFVHGGYVHIGGNLLTLWIFGDNVEDRLGRTRYVLLYLASGVAASLMHIYTNAGSPVPTIGASGAIAGVMGAYFRFYPNAKVETLVPPFFFGPYFVLPAALFLGFWFLLQFFNGFLSLAVGRESFSGVAWWAHVGGFLFGFVVCLFAPRKPIPRYALEDL